MGTVSKNLLTGTTTKENMKEVNLMVRVNTAGPTGHYMKAILCKAVVTDKEVGNLHEKTVTYTSVVTRMIKSVATVDMYGLITASMKATSKAILSK